MYIINDTNIDTYRYKNIDTYRYKNIDIDNYKFTNIDIDTYRYKNSDRRVSFVVRGIGDVGVGGDVARNKDMYQREQIVVST